MPNNIAEFILRVTTEGTGNAQALAGQLNQVDQMGKQVTVTMVSATAAQRACTTEVVQTHSQLARLTQEWGNLQGQIDHFSAHTLQEFSATSAHVLTQWIEGSANAREAFRGFASSVIEGIIQMMIQQTIAHALGIGLMQTSATVQTSTNTEIAASAAPAAVTEGAATFGANTIGVALVLAAIVGGIAAILATSHHAEGGPFYGSGGDTSDSNLAWLSNNEFVHRASAHRYYGTDVMHAINQQRIPREAIHAAMTQRAFAVGGPVIPTGSFIGHSSAGVPPAMVSVGGPTVLMAFGPQEIDRLMATTEVQRHLTSHLDRNTHRIARNIQRTGGRHND